MFAHKGNILSAALQSGAFTDENLVNKMMTSLAAGHKITARAMKWVIYTLAHHPDIQSRLRAEIRAFLSPLVDTITPVTVWMLEPLHYLHVLGNEILRVYPPVAIPFRKAARDTTIQETLISKGILIILCPFAANMSSSLWGPDSKFSTQSTGSAKTTAGRSQIIVSQHSCMGQEVVSGRRLPKQSLDPLGSCNW